MSQSGPTPVIFKKGNHDFPRHSEQLLGVCIKRDKSESSRLEILTEFTQPQDAEHDFVTLEVKQQETLP